MHDEVTDSISSAIAAGLAKSAKNAQLKRKAEATLQSAVLPVDASGAGLRGDARKWFVSLASDGSNLIDFGPVSFEAGVSGDGAGVAQLPALEDGVAQVEGVDEFSSAKAAGVLLHDGA